MTNPYLDLTAAFNAGRLRALVSSGQAVVLHRLAIMSKDGDWVLREDAGATDLVLEVLGAHHARYRFGAPLDIRWLSGGWSSHLEHWRDGLRLRTDFVSRPPRIAPAELSRIWQQAEASGLQVIPLEPLARIKMSLREKDYAVIGELARRMSDPRLELLYSRSARDLLRLAADYPDLLIQLTERRPVLEHVARGRDALEAELDRERRALMHADEARMARYRAAAAAWAATWPRVAKEIEGLPLADAHRILTSRAESVLPFIVPGEAADA